MNQVSLKDFEEQIHPFSFVQSDQSFSIILPVGSYKHHIFLTRQDEGFQGCGYEWSSLAELFLSESPLKSPQWAEIHMDPEADMFCIYSKNAQALQEFTIVFKAMCEDEVLLLNFLSRIELD